MGPRKKKFEILPGQLTHKSVCRNKRITTRPGTLSNLDSVTLVTNAESSMLEFNVSCAELQNAVSHGKAEHVYGSWSYNFISLQWTRACSSCLQVHLVALDLRMHLMSLLRNWDLATAAIKDQGSKSLNNLGGPHAAQRISIRTKCEKTKQYIQYRTRVSASKRVLLTQDRGI